MFGSTRGSRAKRWLWGLLLALPVATYAANQPDGTATDAEAFTRRFLDVAYPRLPAPQIVGAGRAGMASLDVTFSESDAAPVVSQEAYLSGNVRFEHHRMSQVSLRGRYLSSPDRDQMRDLNSNGRFESLTAFEAELRRRGARYLRSARSEFVAALDVERFAPLLGAFLREPEIRGPSEIGDVDWLVTLRTVEPNGLRMCYGLFFEVFNGRLAGVLAMPMGSFKGAKLDECWPGK